MVDMILATDMAVHGLHLTEFENMIEASNGELLLYPCCACAWMSARGC